MRGLGSDHVTDVGQCKTSTQIAWGRDIQTHVWTSVKKEEKSGVRCQVSCVACHLSHVTDANSHSNGPFPLPYYAQQDGLERPPPKKKKLF